MYPFKILVCFLITSGFFLTLHAQSTITTTGGNANGDGLVSFTVGQITQNTFSGTSGTIYQGVQQYPEITYITKIDNNEILIESFVYPNPNGGKIKLIVEATEYGNLWYILYGRNGVLLKTKLIQNRETEIDFEDASSGVFLLKLIKDKQMIKVIKIIKR